MSKRKKYIIVDVGCIECGEQTEVVGIYTTKKSAEEAFNEYAESKGIKKWEPRGGFLELLGLYEASESTYLGGCGYFDGGQHAIELHVFPPQEIPKE